LLLKDEVGPDVLAPSGVPDRPTDAQLTGGGRHPALLGGQAVRGGAQRAPLVGGIRGQRRAFVGDGWGESRHGWTLSMPEFAASFHRTLSLDPGWVQGCSAGGAECL
jgi:hypothetical protein